MDNATDKINIIELLMQIQSDVSSIKTEIGNLKENFNKDTVTINKRIDSNEEKISALIKKNEELEDKIKELQNSDDKKDAKRYRTILAYICTAIAGMFVAKLPEMIKTLYLVLSTKK